MSLPDDLEAHAGSVIDSNHDMTLGTTDADHQAPAWTPGDQSTSAPRVRRRQDAAFSGCAARGR